MTAGRDRRLTLTARSRGGSYRFVCWLAACATAAATPVAFVGCSADGTKAPTAGTHATPTAAAAATAAPSASASWTLPQRPARTRSGQLRFANAELHDNPAVAREILQRLASEPDPEIRAALCEALPRTGGDWIAEVAAHFAEEPDARVRLAIAAIAPRAREAGAVVDAALVLLADALKDPDDGVRTEAAHAVASVSPRPGADHELVARVSALLSDPSARARAAAARALGVLKEGASFEAVRALLSDPVGDVRLQALHALDRIAPSRAEALPELPGLARDRDPRVARLATKLEARAHGAVRP